MALDDSEIDSLGVATLNLRCAMALEPRLSIDVEACSSVLNGWASAVGDGIARMLGIFRRSPERFANSISRFRAMSLVTVLQRDLGIRYSPHLRSAPIETFTLRDIFAHGVIETKQETCASLPVVYAAVGRRLGFPIRLVRSRAHCFARWDDGEKDGERFNIECTSHGFVSHPDEHYLEWAGKSSEGEIRNGRYLVSMTAREELADFLVQGAGYLHDHRRLADATEAVAAAAEIAPATLAYQNLLATLMGRWNRDLHERLPLGIPSVAVRTHARRFPHLPREAEHRLHALRALEDLLVPFVASDNLSARSRTDSIPGSIPRRICVTIH
jgi:hypothetical protein